MDSDAEHSGDPIDWWEVGYWDGYKGTYENEPKVAKNITRYRDGHWRGADDRRRERD